MARSGRDVHDCNQGVITGVTFAGVKTAPSHLRRPDI
jgi:hypothetical protein